MKKVLVSVLFLNLLCTANAQDWSWFIHHVGYAADIDVTDAGNIHMGGFYGDTAIYGANTFIPVGVWNHPDVLSVQFDANGVVTSANSEGGDYEDRCYGISHDNFGNTYVTGHLNISAQFDSLFFSIDGDYDIFVAKYDASGDFLWVKVVGGSEYDTGNDIATDDQGNSYVVGEFRDTVYFDSHMITAPWIGQIPTAHIFLAKYDSNGNAQWARSAGSWHAEVNAVEIDNNGDVFITGYYNDSITFGNTTLYSNGSRDLFIAKYNPNGDALWATSIGGTGWDEGIELSANNASEIFVSGVFSETLQAGGTTLVSAGSIDILLAKYDATGNIDWIKQSGGSGIDYGNAIEFNESDSTIILGGSFRGTAQFDSVTATSSGSDDLFLASYDTNGNLNWFHATGGAMVERITCIDQDAQGAIYASGFFVDTVTFGANTYYATPMSEGDMFIIKIFDAPNDLSLQETNISSNIRIAPNPASGLTVISLENGSLESGSLSLFDEFGNRIAAEYSIIHSEIALSTESLAPGIYLVEIETGSNRIIRRKLVVLNR